MGELLFSRLHALHESARQAEEDATKHWQERENDAEHYWLDEEDDADDTWEQHQRRRNHNADAPTRGQRQHQHGEHDTKQDSVSYKGRRWERQQGLGEGLHEWNGSYWKEAEDYAHKADPGERSLREETPQAMPVDSSEAQNQSTQAKKKGPRDEDMPHAIGQEDPYKKQRIDGEDANLEYADSVAL